MGCHHLLCVIYLLLEKTLQSKEFPGYKLVKQNNLKFGIETATYKGPKKWSLFMNILKQHLLLRYLNRKTWKGKAKHVHCKKY